MKTRQNSQKKMLLSTLVALLVVSMATGALAQGPGQGQGRGGRGGFGDGNFGPEMRMERMAQRLDLSADQMTTIKEIRTKGRSANLELRKEMMRLRNEKRGEMLKDDPSTKTVLGLTTKIGDLRTELQTNRVSNRLEVRKVLTPEQRDKMLLSGEGREGRGDRDGFRKGGKQGTRRGDCDNGGKGQWDKGQRDKGQRGNGPGRGNW